MTIKKTKVDVDISTEEKIKNAARTVFHKKGYVATRTRDIAEEAGINLALLNYYFRSKEKLFNIIMTETLSAFVENLSGVLNDEKTTLENKIALITEKYIDLIIEEPEVPVFIVTEVRNNPTSLLKTLPVNNIVFNSVFLKQHQKAVADGLIKEPNPLHFFMNLISLIVFPFITKPLLLGISEIDQQMFDQLMNERKKLIPIWVQAMMAAE